MDRAAAGQLRCQPCRRASERPAQDLPWSRRREEVPPISAVQGTGGKIEVAATTPDGQGILRTHKRFAGVVHRLVRERLDREGLAHFYKVRIHRDALESAAAATAQLQAKKPLDPDNKTWPVELGDRLIADVLKERHKLAPYNDLPRHGWFAFNVGADGPQVWDQGPEQPAQNTAEPVQSYHPVYFLDDPEPSHLNFAHLTDIHINSRLDILQKNPATVLPYKESDVARANGSLPIRELIQPTNRSFAQLLRAMKDDSDAHALLIGGDLIDHQVNAFVAAKPPATMEDVWAAVDMGSKSRSERYAAGVDMVAFYSLLIDFCRSSQKPVFGVNGNHDCYVKPFGISPRVLSSRANAGIPADINLTFYEAALAFGPSWTDCEVPGPELVTGKPPSSFEKEWIEWFYAVFTPFSDFSAKLPKQQLVCLGWGDNEDMFRGNQDDPSSLVGGHLPRSDQSVSDVQLALLRAATSAAAERRVIALTHFTIASFLERVPLLDVRTHKPSGGWICGENLENEFNMGTFESHRNELLALLSGQKITCILSGHSHRRGLYFVGELEQKQFGSLPVTSHLPVTIHDPDGYKIPSDQALPALVVSDSGGPYPRYNRLGEFMGWGSDRPSGSIVMFETSGRPREVKVVRAGLPPRLAVAVDYLDMEALGHDTRAISIETEPFARSDEHKLFKPSLAGDGASFTYELNVRAHKNLADAKIHFQRIVLHAPDKLPPLSLTIDPADARDGVFKVHLDLAQSRAFYRWIREAEEPDRFVAVFFDWSGNQAVSRRYDAAGPWIFEVAVGSSDTFDEVNQQYKIARPWRDVGGGDGSADWQDVPDFSWRQGFRQKTDELPPGGLPTG